MTFVFYSRYLSHHQLPFCLEMYRQLGDNFRFIASEPISEVRLSLGYPDLNDLYPFVLKTYESDVKKEKAMRLINNADVVMFGGVSMEHIRTRLANGKIALLYSERLYKRGVQHWKLPVRMLRFYREYGQYPNCYLLCASAYTAGDFAKTFTFLNKTYKWGYFPEVKQYDDIHALIARKKPHSITFAGRFIDWKHPELVVEIAGRLKADGYDFHVNMIGNGEIYDTIADMVKTRGLQDHVRLLGAMSPEEVREHMEQSEIYLFTSDRNEGWGAVLNEAMNSGCAVVASHTIGAVPFLMEDGKNGLVFRSGNADDLYQKVKYLLDHPDACKQLGTAAYETMTKLWNAELAAQRLLTLAQSLMDGNKRPDLYPTGPCSKAQILNERCLLAK